MTFTKTRIGLAVLGGAFVLGATAAEAQTPYREDPGTALTRHLRAISDDPRSLSALMGAGKAALQLGDPQAAVTFFARAEEIAPRDPRIKAGFGSAFLQMEQAQSALKFFSDASSMGIAESEIAGDRGLARDLTGDPRGAQADYRLALRAANDPEIERRLALSLAIGGDKAGALALLDGQLQRQDRAAWRTRAFVLALAGDTAGATQAVQMVMPAQAAALQPFLARLPSLDVTGRAMAVHFGHFPGDGQPIRTAQANQYASLSAATPQGTSLGRAQPAQTAVRNVPAEPLASAVRRRPGTAATGALIDTSARAVSPQRSAPPSGFDIARGIERRPRTDPPRVETPPPIVRQAPAVQPVAQAPVQQAPVRQAPAQLALATPAPQAPPLERWTPPQEQAQPIRLADATPSTPTGGPVADQPTALAASPVLESFGPPVDAAASAAAPASAPEAQPAAIVASPVQTVALPQSVIETPPPPAAVVDEPKAEAPTPPKPSTPESAAPKPRKALAFAEVVEAIRALPDGETRTTPVRTASAPVRPAAAKPAAKPATAPATADTPSRHWVQIASAPDSLVTSEYRRLKRKHSGLLSDKEGYRAPMGKSNRVLVGPFANAGDAKDFVGRLKGNSLTAIAWTSADGQEIEKLQ